MGVCMCLQALNDEKIDELSRNPLELQNIVSAFAWASPSMAQVMAGMVQRDPRLADLAELISRQNLTKHLGPQLDLEKSFHGLHYLFTGSVQEGEEPLCYLLHKGRGIGACNIGEVKAISGDQLAAFEAALQAIDKKELLRRYDAKPMAEAEINVFDVVCCDTEDGREYFCEKLVQLKEFLKAASVRKQGMIIWLT